LQNRKLSNEKKINISRRAKGQHRRIHIKDYLVGWGFAEDSLRRWWNKKWREKVRCTTISEDHWLKEIRETTLNHT
jgi:hypothetical protein